MNEITFIVEEAPEGGFTAHALGESIFTEADTWEGLKEAAKEAVRAHFEHETYRVRIINNAQ
ncbi:MAG: 2-oxoisovalerate dehydrogenase [Anaerolineales bacterium]|nr:2-oxoisovalerate dehydrogenase [Anaerolineales bacterium]